jgi:hypothetical protein
MDKHSNTLPSWNRHEPRRAAGLMLGMLTVFIVGLIAGSFLFAFGANTSTPNNFNDGKMALAFLLNGTASTGHR